MKKDNPKWVLKVTFSGDLKANWWESVMAHDNPIQLRIPSGCVMPWFINMRRQLVHELIDDKCRRASTYPQKQQKHSVQYQAPPIHKAPEFPNTLHECVTSFKTNSHYNQRIRVSRIICPNSSIRYQRVDASIGTGAYNLKNHQHSMSFEWILIDEE